MGRIASGIIKPGMNVIIGPKEILTEARSIEMHFEILNKAH